MKQLPGSEIADWLTEVHVESIDAEFGGITGVSRLFVMTVGKYGEAEATVSGVYPSVRKCVADAFDEMARTPNWISDDFLEHGEIRFTGAITVEMAWVP